MVKQTDEKCLPIIQKIGCFLRCCGYLAESVTKKELTADQINELWAWSKKNGHINDENNVRHSAPIATQALRLLNCQYGKFREVGLFAKGELKYYQGITEAQKNKPTFFIQKIKTNGPEGTHFRVIDARGNLIFEPYKNEIKAQGVFYSIIYIYEG